MPTENSCQAESAAKWQEAITDCERELQPLVTRVEQLKSAIRTFKANLERGMPWPGKRATRN